MRNQEDEMSNNNFVMYNSRSMIKETSPINIYYLYFNKSDHDNVVTLIVIFFALYRTVYVCSILLWNVRNVKSYLTISIPPVLLGGGAFIL